MHDNSYYQLLSLLKAAPTPFPVAASTLLRSPAQFGRLPHRLPLVRGCSDSCDSCQSPRSSMCVPREQ